MNLSEKLLNIQNELKAPKNQKNSFGGYNYRSCEDILEAVKPILLKYKTTLTIQDEICYVCDNAMFIKSVATLKDCESEDIITNQAFAQLGDHKGMSSEQCTGTASSYCRKYCLNGLFLIDDTKDPDTDEFHKQTTKVETKKVVKKETFRNKLIKLCKENDISVNEIAVEYDLTVGCTEKDYQNAYESVCERLGVK